MGSAIPRQVGQVYEGKVIEQASNQCSSAITASSTCLDSLDDGLKPVSQIGFSFESLLVIMSITATEVQLRCFIDSVLAGCLGRQEA